MSEQIRRSRYIESVNARVRQEAGGELTALLQYTLGVLERWLVRSEQGDMHVPTGNAIEPAHGRGSDYYVTKSVVVSTLSLEGCSLLPLHPFLPTSCLRICWMANAEV